VKLPKVSIRTENYLAQLHAAGQMERDYYQQLKDNGWVWDGLQYTHPDAPGVSIMPG